MSCMSHIFNFYLQMKGKKTLTLRNTYAELMKLAKNFRIVKVAKVGSVPVSDMYNPMGLECRCWAGRHDGICSHILAVNAFKKHINLKTMLQAVDTPKHANRPKALHYMQKTSKHSHRKSAMHKRKRHA